MKLLTTSNAKILKSIDFGYLTFGLHFAPATLSGREVCPWRSDGCSKACLNTAGQGIFPAVQSSRIQKTKLFFERREDFLSQFWKEIERAIAKASKKALIPVFRLNLTSDIPWESIKFKGLNVFETFPEVQFMDYTKGIGRFSRFLRGELPGNYHLTFSKSESNHNETSLALALGGNVAVVFWDKLPESFMGKAVVDGDKNDLRFLDPKGCVVGLSAKGKAKKDLSGFVVDSSVNQR